MDSNELDLFNDTHRNMKIIHKIHEASQLLTVISNQYVVDWGED